MTTGADVEDTAVQPTGELSAVERYLRQQMASDTKMASDRKGRKLQEGLSRDLGVHMTAHALKQWIAEFRAPLDIDGLRRYHQDFLIQVLREHPGIGWYALCNKLFDATTQTTSRKVAEQWLKEARVAMPRARRQKAARQVDPTPDPSVLSHFEDGPVSSTAASSSGPSAMAASTAASAAVDVDDTDGGAMRDDPNTPEHDLAMHDVFLREQMCKTPTIGRYELIELLKRERGMAATNWIMQKWLADYRRPLDVHGLRRYHQQFLIDVLDENPTIGRVNLVAKLKRDTGCTTTNASADSWLQDGKNAMGSLLTMSQLRPYSKFLLSERQQNEGISDLRLRQRLYDEHGVACSRRAMRTFLENPNTDVEVRTINATDLDDFHVALTQFLFEHPDATPDILLDYLVREHNVSIAIGSLKNFIQAHDRFLAERTQYMEQWVEELDFSFTVPAFHQLPTRITIRQPVKMLAYWIFVMVLGPAGTGGLTLLVTFHQPELSPGTDHLVTHSIGAPRWCFERRRHFDGALNQSRAIPSHPLHAVGLCANHFC